MRVRATEVAEQREVERVGRRLGDRERDPEDRVGAELLLVVCAVELDHRRIDEALVGGVEALESRAEYVDDGRDGLLDALAAVALLVTVAKLVGLERAGRCSGGDGRASDDSVVEQNLDLHRRVTP